jgi:hypothetical protein
LIFLYLFQFNLFLICFSFFNRRQHQLRVHLQALGFPIHNDVIYGGEVDSSCKNKMKENSIQALNESVKNDRSCVSIEDKVTEEIIQQAKQFSLCRQGKKGIEQSFNSAHLLVEGHAIDLHALTYRIKFNKKRKKKGKLTEDMQNEKPLAIMEFSVRAPSWVDTSIITESSWLDS